MAANNPEIHSHATDEAIHEHEKAEREEVLGSLGGIAVGATVGIAAGPVGAVVGAVTGGLLGAGVTSAIVDANERKAHHEATPAEQSEVPDSDVNEG